jgi:hypothetical protein
MSQAAADAVGKYAERSDGLPNRATIRREDLILPLGSDCGVYPEMINEPPWLAKG